MAIIKDVTSESGLKDRFRCPVCRTTGIKERRHKSPRFRCNNRHEFETPLSETISVVNYTASYGENFIPAPGALGGPQLREAALRPNHQMSIE